MKKLFISLAAAIVAATATFAQNTLVATLTHGENVTMYYGTYALRDAHNAAVSGDVINLSGGAFQAVTISKAVTLRGTGIDAQDPTFIINDCYINVGGTGRLSMEGIRFTGDLNINGTFENPNFLKCEFARVNFASYNTTEIKNAMFVDCKFTDEFRTFSNNKSTMQFINCFIDWFSNDLSREYGASFINCIVRDPDYVHASQFINCIFYTNDYAHNHISSSSIANNCVAVKFTDFFQNSQANSGCKTVSNFTDLFKTFTGTYSDSETFELTDAAKTKFLGTDGTQVGMYGGFLPYTSTPSYPQITKMNVANKTTADGKLSVEIEVSTAK